MNDVIGVAILQRAAPGASNPIKVVGMHHVQEALDGRLEPLGFETEDAIGFGRPEQLVRLDLQFPVAEAGDPLRLGQAGLAFADRFLRALTLRDVL